MGFQAGPTRPPDKRGVLLSDSLGLIESRLRAHRQSRESRVRAVHAFGCWVSRYRFPGLSLNQIIRKQTSRYAAAYQRPKLI